MTKKVLYENPNLSLLLADDWYVYAHMSRAERGELVAVLVYKKDTNNPFFVSHFLARYENTLPHEDGLAMSSITGGLDKDHTPKQMVLEELKEEAGIVVPEAEVDERLQNLGTCRPTKQADTLCHLFMLDATGLEQNPELAQGDGSKGEEGSYCKWVAPHLLLGCKCPLVACMAVRGGLLRRI